MATYVIGDIHNSIKKLDNLLTLISPSMRDQIFLLGDLFDRGGADPDPVGVYHRISGLNTNATWIRGNHDQLLADYIYRYYETAEKKRNGVRAYRYNSFDLMMERLTEVDMLNLADLIMRLPLQVEIEVNSVKYLLAHAMTFDPSMGEREDKAYLDEETNSIWLNNQENVYMVDCGCGLAGGRLACICLETGERFYA